MNYFAVKVTQTALAGKFCWKNDRKQVTLLNLEEWNSCRLDSAETDAVISTTLTEAEILADVLSPDQGDLPTAVAEAVLLWKFNHRATAHINELARRNQSGKISAVEREELERYLRVGSFLNLLQAKARRSLALHEES